MKKLPLGLQTFSQIIAEDYLYIDKTKEIYPLLTKDKYYFLSRPRRFGKSLLISTLKEIFSGNQELFKGLYIYDKIEWKGHPVIHIDFSTIDYEDEAQLKKSLLSKMDSLNEEHNLEIKESSLKIYLGNIITALNTKYGSKVVVLIDEYDKPIIDFISQQDKAAGNRNVLRSFFSVLKGLDQYLRFVLLTGVTKFSKVSIFSGLNNITDITLIDDFSTLLGITQEELRTYFKEDITLLSRKEGISEDALLEQIKHWYNGYSWNGIDKVYNPTSLLNLFANKRFSHYWFSTGTPTFLIETMRKNQYEITELEGVTVSEFALDSYDIDHMDVNTLLFQAGYLTVKDLSRKRDSYFYTLSCPNHEVKHSLINYIMADYMKEPASKISPLYLRVVDALEDRKLDTFITIIRAVFAKIPYYLHPQKGDEDTVPGYRESYYHSLFYLILSLMGVKINLEVLTDKGRIDGVLELEDCIYIIEFKRGTPQEAMDQIDDKRYYEPYLDSEKEIFLLGVGGFDEKDIKYICKQIKG